MMSVEESLPASEITEDLASGATFIGYGTEQVIKNNGWVTVWNLSKGGNGSGTAVHLNSFKPSTVSYFPARPANSSTAIPVSVSSVCESSEVNSAGSTSVECVNDARTTDPSSMFGHDELASKTSVVSLAEAVGEKDLVPSVLRTVLSQTSLHDKTHEISLIKQIESRNDSELYDSCMNNKSNDEGNVSSDKQQSQLSVDVALSDNNNYMDTVTLETVKADKAAARLQLNAVLQSEISKTVKAKLDIEISKTVKAKLADVAVCSAETKSSDFTDGQTNRSFINLSGQPRFVVKQNSTGLRTTENMTQVVRIQNAKVVGVFEAEKRDFTPMVTAQNLTPVTSGPVDVSAGTTAPKHDIQSETVVRTGHLEMANDVSKCTSTRYVVFTPLLCNNTVEAKTDCSVVHPQDFDLLDRSNDGASFVFDPLCISADTLVPVAGTAGHGERQNMDMANAICSQPSDGTKNSCGEDAPADSEITMLRCFLCPFFHEKQSKIAEHWIDVHLRQLPYVCSYCDNGFTTSWEAHKHIVRSHPGEKLKVGIKNSTHFASSLAYEVVRSDDVEAPMDSENVVFVRQNLHTCRKCDFQCETSTELRSHQRSFHFKFKPYFCTYCTGKKVSFACGFDLKQHIRARHPERMLTAGNAFRDPVLPRLTADINWSSTYEAISIANQVMFQCRLCAFRTQLSENAWKHVLSSHNWPETVNCPSCSHSFELSGVERESFLASCGKCQAQIYLGPGASDAKPNVRGEPVFMCTVCDYKTMGKGSMNRHLKYNHTKCRPYGCVYCNYVAVERPKVKLHIESLHKGQKIAIKERTESSEGFRRLVEDLFSSIVRVGYYSELSAGTSAVKNTGDQSTEKEPDVDDADTGANSWKRMKLNPAEDNDLDIVICPNSPTEADFELTAQARDRDRKSINGDHFKCMICGYVCTDRSCMSRHIKYMHITSRPHSCPYCRYNNVEKTKVRLHVKSHHPSQPKCVKTNKKLLEDMSSEAKKFYVKVDSAGQVMKDSNVLSLQPNLSSEIDLDESIDMQDSGDSTMNEFFLTELDPEADFIDVQTGEGGATVVLKEGVYQVGIKEEPSCDDDIRIKEEPGGVEMSRSSNISLCSNALDHSYVSNLPDTVTPQWSDMNIKTEPEDTVYEVTVDESFPVDSHVNVDKTFIDFNSESSDEDDGSLVDVSFGAANVVDLDGFDGLDSSEDDLDEDSDLDLLDLADFELDESYRPDVSMVTRRWEFSEQQAEHSRLHLLRRVEMDDDVREDEKIWMRCVVSVEDIISRISANKPIMDM